MEKGEADLKRVIILLVAVTITAAASYIGYTMNQYKQMTREWYHPISPEPPSRIHTAQSPEAPLEAEKKLQPFTLLLIGIDSRDGERARSDTMIVTVVNPENQSVYLLSIPRDSYMQLPGRGYDKLNHAMAYGGASLVKTSLEKFADIKIDRYMTIDFEGFRKVVDELGGVEVNVKKRMKYSDPTDDTYIDLQPGLQVLNGKQALDYARYRKSDIGREDSDYDRIVRQQEILKALASKGDSMESFLKAFKLMEILGKHVKTDLTEEEISLLLRTYYDPKKNHIETDTLAGVDERIWHNGIRGWYYLITKDEQKRVHERIKAELAVK